MTKAGPVQTQALTAATVDTPALLVDLDLVDKNIKTLFAALSASRVTVRPHLKTVKSPFFAKLLIEAGATGVCVAKLGEAKIMAEAGIEDILITTEIIGQQKIDQLIALLQDHPDIKVVVDSNAGAHVLDAAARAAELKTKIKTLVEINVGQNRCGTDPGEMAVALARGIKKFESLQFMGVQGYEGHLQMMTGEKERREACLASMEKLAATARLLSENEMPPSIVTTGGTGTCEICATIPEVTEVQPGSFVFWDMAYRNAVGTKYANALTLVATVISKPEPGRAVVDAGTKSLSTDSGNAVLKDHPEITYRPGGDEHGILECAGGTVPFEIGDRLEFIPSHIDTTVNLHDFYYCHRGGGLTVQPISARGKVQ